ncbi:MAG: NAD-dependent epimerase/dehydratase family protein [Patescibacteria group bacterium]|jgi:UDP-glucose 4-epimerase
MRRILITGSEGNIGAYITESVRRLFPNAEIVRVSRKPNTNGEVRVGDLLDPSFVKTLFDKPIDIVIHAAAPIYNATVYKENPYGVFHDDVQCFSNILENCKTNVKKIIYLSSATVYESVEELPFREESTDNAAAPRSPYGFAKFVNERALKAFSEQHGVDYTIWRLFNIVSPREDHSKPGAHVYVDFYRKLFVERVPVLDIFGDGKQVRSFTWVGDVADTIAQYLEDERTSKQTINLAGEEPHSLIELKDVLLKIGKEKNLLPAEYNPDVKTGEAFFGVEAPKRIPSLEKLNALGWNGATSFESCFETFVTDKQHAHA